MMSPDNLSCEDDAVDGPSHNCVIDYMSKNNIPLTVSNYVSLAWCGDKTFADLEGEELADVEDLIDRGMLVRAEFVN